MNSTLNIHDVISVKVGNWVSREDYKVKKIRIKTENGFFEITLFN